jgi:hypothetical protein
LTFDQYRPLAFPVISSGRTCAGIGEIETRLTGGGDLAIVYRAITI